MKRQRPQLGNVLVVWKSTGGSGSTRLVAAVHDTLGPRARVATLHVGGTVDAAVHEANAAEQLVAAVTALAGAHELVLVEVEGAATMPDESNPRLRAIADLSCAGATAVLITDITSHSLSVGLSRLATLATTLGADPAGLVVVLNRVIEPRGPLRVEEHLVTIGVFNVHRAGLEETGRLGRRAGFVTAGAPLRAVAYDILADMDLPCLGVDDATFADLLQGPAARPVIRRRSA